MPRWQRRARWILAVVFVGVVAAVALLMRQRTTQLQTAPPERLDPTATAEIRGGDVVQLKGERRDVRVEFTNQISYEDGRTKLIAFKATIDNRGGKSYVISGREAWVGAQQSSYDVRGAVSLKTSDGLLVTTEQATFTEAEGVLRGPGPVQFQRENFSGSGVGFTYDRQQDSLWLLEQAQMRFAATETKPAMDVTAGTGGYSRQQRYARFERTVHMTRDNQVIAADQATIFMQPQIDEPDRIELRAGAHITGGGSMGSLQAMEARDINLDYATDGRTLEQAVLAGSAVVQLARSDGATGQQLSGEYIDISLAPDGAVTHLASRDGVRMTLAAVGDQPAREINANVLDGVGEPKKGLTALTFDGNTEFHESGSNGTTRVAKGRTLQAQLGANGTVDRATYPYGFTFADGALRAASVNAQYQVTKGVMSLSSPKGEQPPVVTTERVRIDANAIEVTLSPTKMVGTGSVRTTLNANRHKAGERGNTLLKEDQEVTLAAESLTLDETSGVSVFKDKAFLLQGATSIKADAITLDDKQGNLLATGNVVAVLPIAGKSGEGSKTSTGRAGEFEFTDAKRRAIFSKEAQLDGAQGNVRADRIELVLAPKDNTLDRMEAQGSTVRVAVDKREASGTRLTYVPTGEEYKLVGAPVRFAESCRETTGRTLTFFGASDRILVDGNEEQRTQTKGNSKCPESPN